ncbi:hypothetical protein BMS3Abin14_00002 [bacterium BMS3Abin14]|nr:hypothetical protein BMS3Abin14_00002 [bacterium BMS3Abin14]
MNEFELEKRIQDALVSKLKDLGYSVRKKRVQSSGSFRFDFILSVQVLDLLDFDIYAEVKLSSRLALIKAAVERALGILESQVDGNKKVLFFGASHLSESAQEWLRSKKVSYLDLSGNFFLRSSFVSIFHSGKKRSKEVKEPSPSFFADKSSLVLRELFANKIVEDGVRDLASNLDLSPGLVSRILKQLEESGYLRRSNAGIELQNRNDLLEEWVSFYRLKAKNVVQKKFYIHANDGNEILKILQRNKNRIPGEYALSFHGAASLVAPYAFFKDVHVFIKMKEEWEVNKWVDALNLEYEEYDSNFFLMKPYYRISSFFRVRDIQGLSIVSDLQMYLDLMTFPKRGEEQAREILERLISPVWEV